MYAAVQLWQSSCHVQFVSSSKFGTLFVRIVGNLTFQDVHVKNLFYLEGTLSLSYKGKQEGSRHFGLCGCLGREVLVTQKAFHLKFYHVLLSGLLNPFF